MRLIRLLSATVLCVALVAGCVEASAGWTLAPEPSITPVPSAGSSEEPTTAPSSDRNVVKISASGIKFEQSSLTAPADTAFKIEFDNKDPGTPHNVAIHEGSPTGTEAWKGEVFNGPAVKTYEVPALKAGAYAFVCTVHPTMTGTLTVQ